MRQNRTIQNGSGALAKWVIRRAEGTTSRINSTMPPDPR